MRIFFNNEDWQLPVAFSIRSLIIRWRHRAAASRVRGIGLAVYNYTLALGAEWLRSCPVHGWDGEFSWTLATVV